MAEVIDMERYRAGAGEHGRDGLFLEIIPPVILVRYYDNGVLMHQYRADSEEIIRDLLDLMG